MLFFFAEEKYKKIYFDKHIKDHTSLKMEMIDISGYVPEEKLVIAQKYLIPQVNATNVHVSL